ECFTPGLLGAGFRCFFPGACARSIAGLPDFRLVAVFRRDRFVALRPTVAPSEETADDAALTALVAASRTCPLIVPAPPLTASRPFAALLARLSSSSDALSRTRVSCSAI